jgi:hypothetical protein
VTKNTIYKYKIIENNNNEDGGAGKNAVVKTSHNRPKVQ